jgi:hypothetical protein
MKGTVIFVSSNKETPEFEKHIIDDLKSKVGDLEVISVTQKPVDLGQNFVVGDVGASGFNFCRQVYRACIYATGDYVISAESDCLYSPDYFNFVPERLDIPYRNTNIYVQKYGQDFACKKTMSTFSQVIGRDFYISRLQSLFEGLPMWSTEYKNFPKEIGKKLFNEFETFETMYPCISFKTGRGMRKHSNTDEVPIYDLPYWGSIKELRKKYEAN